MVTNTQNVYKLLQIQNYIESMSKFNQRWPIITNCNIIINIVICVFFFNFLSVIVFKY